MTPLMPGAGPPPTRIASVSPAFMPGKIVRRSRETLPGMWFARIFLAAGTLVLLSTGQAWAKTVDVAIQTGLGTIVIRLDPTKAPVTAGNFLKYVDAHIYN